MRLVSGVFCVLMIAFSAVQYNDPDTLIWILIYGATAVICGLFAYRPAMLSSGAGFAALTAALIASVAGVIYYWPHTEGWWHKDVWWITETAREGMGMMIVLAFLLIVWLFARKSRSAT